MEWPHSCMGQSMRNYKNEGWVAVRGSASGFHKRFATLTVTHRKAISVTTQPGPNSKPFKATPSGGPRTAVCCKGAPHALRVLPTARPGTAAPVQVYHTARAACTALEQYLDSLLCIPLAFSQCLLAVHHARARLLAQRLDVARRHVCTAAETGQAFCRTCITGPMLRNQHSDLQLVSYNATLLGMDIVLE